MGAREIVRKKVSGIALITIGLTLTTLSVLAYAACGYQEQQADEAVQLVLNELTLERDRQQEARIYQPISTEALPAGEPQQLTWNGCELIGTLRIPGLELELPIMRTWDDDLLQISPCRYSGSAETEDLILLAHNYQRHFGQLKQLTAGAAVEFEDVSGTVYHYAVTETEILQKTELDRLTEPGHALTLFTCTPGGRSRYVVRCALLTA